MLYHIAPARKVPQIQQTGLHPTSEQTEHTRRRHAMHTFLSDVAAEMGMTLPEREHAVYMWPTLDQALEYAQKIQTPRIIELDPGDINGQLWTAPSETVELLFESVCYEDSNHNCDSLVAALHESEECCGLAREIVSSAGPYSPGTSHKHEVWTPTTVSSAAITTIEK